MYFCSWPACPTQGVYIQGTAIEEGHSGPVHWSTSDGFLFKSTTAYFLLLLPKKIKYALIWTWRIILLSLQHPDTLYKTQGCEFVAWELGCSHVHPSGSWCHRFCSLITGQHGQSPVQQWNSGWTDKTHIRAFKHQLTCLTVIYFLTMPGECKDTQGPKWKTFSGAALLLSNLFWYVCIQEYNNADLSEIKAYP